MNNQFSGTVIGGVLNLRQALFISAKCLSQIPSGTHFPLVDIKLMAINLYRSFCSISTNQKRNSLFSWEWY